MSGIKWVLYDWFGYNWIISQRIHLLIRNEFAISLLRKFSNALGDWHLFPVHMGLVLAIMYAYIYSHKPQQRLEEAIRYVKYIILWLCSITIAVVIIKTLKYVLHYARPCCTHGFSLADHVHQFLKPDYCITDDYSFPSGHTAYITLFVTSFWSLMDKKFKVVSVFLVGLMMFSRVVLSHHFVADTVYALLIVLYLVHPLSSSVITRFYPRYDAFIRQCAGYFFRVKRKPE
jgi:membrane-associated phospholipid phosphatase